MGDLVLKLDIKAVFGITVALLASVNGVTIDDEFKDNIVEKHNNLRQQVRATSMNEMNWDEGLARKAEQWASFCKYEYPPEVSYPFNSNLYWMSSDILESDPDMMKEFIDRAVYHWERTSQHYIYGTHCGKGCPYARMVDSDTESVGCAVKSCSNQYYTNIPSYPVTFTMIVCIYNPGKDLRRSNPYQQGNGCSRCQGRRVCRNDLCVLSALDYNERRLLLIAHNEMRRSRGLNDLEWDEAHLERWVNYIIDCSVNYPGPRGTYSNFHRFQELEGVGSVAGAWSREGSRTSIRFVHGCRTKNDAIRCNHYTNVIRPDINSIACAAKNCGTRRHLVCLYDDMGERQYWREYSERMRPRYRPTHIPDFRPTWFNTPTPRPRHWHDHENEFSSESGHVDVLDDQQSVSATRMPRRRPPPSIYTKASKLS